MSRCVVSVIQATNAKKSLIDALVIFRYNSISSSDRGDLQVAEFYILQMVHLQYKQMKIEKKTILSRE